jgi:hypothetical protein
MTDDHARRNAKWIWGQEPDAYQLQRFKDWAERLEQSITYQLWSADIRGARKIGVENVKLRAEIARLKSELEQARAGEGLK